MGRLREAWIAPREKRKLTCEITLVNTAIVSLRTGLDSWNLATDQKAGSSNPSERMMMPLGELKVSPPATA